VWSPADNGTVTKEINKNDPVATANSNPVPDISSMLEKAGFNIIKSKTDTIQLELLTKINGRTIQLFFDGKTWLLHKTLMYGGSEGVTEILYSYLTFSGRSMPKQMISKIGNLGVYRISYSDYRKIEDKDKEFFHAF
jgi:hypothetical protein